MFSEKFEIQQTFGIRHSPSHMHSLSRKDLAAADSDAVRKTVVITAEKGEQIQRRKSETCRFANYTSPSSALQPLSCGLHAALRIPTGCRVGFRV